MNIAPNKGNVPVSFSGCKWGKGAGDSSQIHESLLRADVDFKTNAGGSDSSSIICRILGGKNHFPDLIF